MFAFYIDWDCQNSAYIYLKQFACVAPDVVNGVVTLKNAMVALFRGDAHTAGKAAAHCTDQIETLQWEVLQDTHTALVELRKLCDDCAEDGTILTQKDHDAIVGAKAKAHRYFAEALCKISKHGCFADALGNDNKNEEI